MELATELSQSIAVTSGKVFSIQGYWTRIGKWGMLYLTLKYIKLNNNKIIMIEVFTRNGMQLWSGGQWSLVTMSNGYI